MDEWERLFNEAEGQLEALAIDSRVGASNFEKSRRATGNESIAGRLVKVGRDVAVLETLTRDIERDPISYHIGTDELERRLGMLANLKIFLENVCALSTGVALQRVELFDRAEETEIGGPTVGGGAHNEEKLLQQEEEEDQDEKLDIIGEGLERLKGMSYDINYELEMHASLLQEIDANVDSANHNMRANIHGVESMNRSSNSSRCSLSLMAVLFAVIVVLLSIDLPCGPCTGQTLSR
jgi:hypothetical protein